MEETIAWKLKEKLDASAHHVGKRLVERSGFTSVAQARRMFRHSMSQFMANYIETPSERIKLEARSQLGGDAFTKHQPAFAVRATLATPKRIVEIEGEKRIELLEVRLRNGMSNCTNW